jgi:hypothetical protein
MSEIGFVAIAAKNRTNAQPITLAPAVLPTGSSPNHAAAAAAAAAQCGSVRAAAWRAPLPADGALPGFVTLAGAAAGPTLARRSACASASRATGDSGGCDGGCALGADATAGSDGGLGVKAGRSHRDSPVAGLKKNVGVPGREICTAAVLGQLARRTCGGRDSVQTLRRHR